MPRPPTSRDPRYRPYRVAVLTVYLVVVSAFSLLVTVSVARSVRAMTPRREPVRTATLDREACTARAAELYGALEDRRRALAAVSPASRADGSWMSFRVEWLDRLRQAERSCGVDAADRGDLARLFQQLEHLENLYGTSAVQYSGEVGPALDRFHRMLAAAKQPQ